MTVKLIKKPVLTATTFRQRHLLSAMVVVVFAAVSFVSLQLGHAATFAASREAEAGSVSGNSGPGSTAGTSGNASVKFGISPDPASGSIIFQDDFNGANGSAFDHSKWGQWSACTYNGSAAYGNILCGEDETLDGEGHLIIPATPNRGQSLTTGDRFKFVYGTLSAWIKFPPQAGYWPAFWTLNNNANGINAPFLGELDVMEGYTTWEDGVIAGSGYHAGFHNWANTGSVPHTGGGPDLCPQPGINMSAAFHKFTAKIEPDKLSFFFDDKPCGTAYGPATNPGMPYGFGPSITNGNWLILTLAVGGAGGQQKPAVDNARMLVDRVEVRSL